ncbi:MAG: short chain dehydrogenase [Legionellales bacterium]|nr:short chain dehydrogenase [Legionellales bacterium]
MSKPVALITGASRGIGFYIAKTLSSLGYRTVILAKTTTPHPTLPGTIYTAAEAISQLGETCLPIPTDLRDSEQIDQAFEQVRNTYGRLDLLVNNAGAVKLTDSLHLPNKHYDLMQQVNGRSCFLCCQAAHPLLTQGDNPHIINISPPIQLSAEFLLPHLAYAVSKYSMSLYTIGLSQAFKQDKIAINSLWPRYIVETAAINHLSPSLKTRCRTPQIMADAVAWIVKQDSQTFTGQLLTDEQVLEKSGVSDFSQYAIDPEKSLFKDLFVD